jgi:hypothetical protein
MSLRAIATHRLTLWVALAAALIFILWATAVSAQQDPLPRYIGATDLATSAVVRKSG